MILTLAPNPALERVALVEEFTPGVSGKPMRVATFAGGAGLRAANVVRLLGGEVLALGFVGGHLGALLRDCLDRQDIPHVLTPTQASTRGSFLVLDKEKGIVTDIPELSPVPTLEERDRLLGTLSRHLSAARLLIVADEDEDSDPEFYTEAIRRAEEKGIPVIADLRGEALEAALATGVFFVRMSLRTLQKRTPTSVRNDSAILAAVREIVAGGVQNVVVTLAEEGALLAGSADDSAWRIQAPVVSHFNPTGSGHTLTGAFAVSFDRTGDVRESVRFACAAASVNVTHDEPGYATPGEIAVLLPKTTVQPIGIR